MFSRECDEWQRRRSKILSEGSLATKKFHPLWLILIFLGLYLGTILFFFVPISILSQIFPKLTFTIIEGLGGSADIIISLFLTGFPILMAILYVRKVERRSIGSMGFFREGWLKSYGKGFLIGLAMCATTLLICLATGTMEYQGPSTATSIGIWLLTLAGFLVQGMSEEVMFRGFLTVSLAERLPVWLSVLISSVVFALFHGLNSGLTTLSLVNLVLFGIFAALMMLRYDNIWGIGALHSAWNFAQGNIFGVAVSGSDAGETILNFAPIEGAPKWLSGGAFGLEGSIATTIVFGVMALVMLRKLLPPKRAEICAEE